ncbi:hypothetical protein KP78_04600 [Jeotgalibacillus soli]|uniref:Uncharacterized protein n=1 Tax=Jeotgalibacillus soli TaxID=889306 RepID=A0A0C2RPB5_9BACL|nr:hypothetical protein KP78_04600 [Jeotgalibacillus soli]
MMLILLTIRSPFSEYFHVAVSPNKEEELNACHHMCFL